MKVKITKKVLTEQLAHKPESHKPETLNCEAPAVTPCVHTAVDRESEKADRGGFVNEATVAK